MIFKQIKKLNYLAIATTRDQIFTHIEIYSEYRWQQ